MSQSQASAVFPAHPLYRGLALAAFVAVLLLLWELRHGWTWSHGLVGGLALATALYYGRLALSRVELAATHVHVIAPMTRPRGIERRQIADVHSEGRLIPAILVIYHPRRADGLFDHENLRSLTLPAVVGQDALLAALGGRAEERPAP
jgi:hypothetical protein